jgi:AcrR family transcriptional regulator
MRIDIAGIRREQIIEAAMAVIAEQGLQNLSLSEIEKKAGMSRGQLTYYFPAKEDILLAVFDRLLELMRARAQANVDGEDGGCNLEGPHGWERVELLLRFLILRPPAVREFHSLQYTFLAQISHRPDFRQRLADLYEEWRTHMTADLAREMPANSSPRALATLIQAILHGLAMQRNADPDAFDGEEMLDLCLEVLGSYLHKRGIWGGTPQTPRNRNGNTRTRPKKTPPRREKP